MNLGSGQITSDGGDFLFSKVPAAAADENFCATWLAIQCEIITGVNAGLISLVESDGSMQPAAA